MIKLFRSLFGQPDPAGKRTVVGQAAAVDLKEVKYIQDSSARLNLLNNLCTKYKGTPHESKIKTVYEKTKNIHSYLVSKKRVTELELFHLQHTDHFINTFSIIIEVHQRYQESIFSSAQNNLVAENTTPEKVGWEEQGSLLREPVRRAGNPQTISSALKTEVAVSKLLVPVVSINTFTQIPYTKGDTLGAITAREIGFTSSESEKENFLAEVRAHLGIKNLAYLGNALVNIPQSNGAGSDELVPILRWQSCIYALSLNDFRLFPVKVNW
jgi:hypothetical protein